MATHRIPILSSAKPDGSGDVFFEPYSVKATNDQWDPLVLVFNDTSARDAIYGTFDVPQNYSSSADIVVVWTTTATTGDVEFDFDYRAVGGDDAESLDQTGTQESVNVADTAPSAAHERMAATLSLTDGNLAAGDTVEFLLARDGADAGDTISAAVVVFGAYFEYSDT